jgi:hypothetical protein
MAAWLPFVPRSHQFAATKSGSSGADIANVRSLRLVTKSGQSATGPVPVINCVDP